MIVRLRNLESSLKKTLTQLRSDDSPVQNSRAIVDQALTSGAIHYGINTGFGILANQRVDHERLETLQRNLILSHAVGVGRPVPKAITKRMLQLKIVALGKGYSGVSNEVFSALLEWEAKGVVPVVFEKGSVGASGDLAPLAHLFLPLLGLGEIWDETGEQRLSYEEASSRYGLQPVTLQPKDGLALINGTQFMAGYGVHLMEKVQHILIISDILGAMSLEALQGSITPFDQRIHEIRPHTGQQQVASNVRRLLQGSEILESHRNCGKVQDPYCLRCIPQVHGASRDALAYTAKTIETEINSVTDNPLVFPNGDILSGGNFHGQPLAIALDTAAMALAELASISERRTYLLLGGHDGLPKLLMNETGINSGFMIPQYTSAALVSENKVLAHPACVDSIPTSLGQEDHVSMGSISAVKLAQIVENVEYVLAIEWFTAAQALDYRQPLKPGRGVEIAHQFIRSRVEHTEVDKFLNDDINHTRDLLHDASLIQHIEEEVAELYPLTW